MSTKDTVIHLTTESGIPIKVIKSSRRTRSSQGRWVNDHVEVRMPSFMTAESTTRVALSLAERVLEKRDSKYGPENQEDLMDRAMRLSRQYLMGQPRPVSVRWVTNQGRRWGSANYTRQTINLSHRLWGMPDWVIDAVLVHELAHLMAPDGHGPAFKARIARYPRTADADIFLLGFSHGKSYAERQAHQAHGKPGDQFGGLFDDEETGADIDEGPDADDVEAS